MSQIFEIVELDNGDVALKRADEPMEEALVKIQFSDDAKASLQTHQVDVARVMLEAGVRKVGQISGFEVEKEDFVSVNGRHQVH